MSSFENKHLPHENEKSAFQKLIALLEKKIMQLGTSPIENKKSVYEIEKSIVENIG